MSRPTLSINDYAHIYNRGVDRRITFNDNSDYVRFLHTIYVCNDVEFTIKNLKRTLQDVQHPTLHICNKSANRLVDILCFTLMPNHFHLLLKQNVDGGISQFMKRVGNAYTKYFNIKYNRKGVLFQGKYRYRIITNEQYLVYLSQYIHLNPIKLINPEWKIKRISNWKDINAFLEGYKWSSYQDYIGIKNFPSIINTGFLQNYFNKPEEYKKFINNYLVEDISNLDQLI